MLNYHFSPRPDRRRAPAGPGPATGAPPPETPTPHGARGRHTDHSHVARATPATGAPADGRGACPAPRRVNRPTTPRSDARAGREHATPDDRAPTVLYRPGHRGTGFGTDRPTGRHRHCTGTGTGGTAPDRNRTGVPVSTSTSTSTVPVPVPVPVPVRSVAGAAAGRYGTEVQNTRQAAKLSARVW
jgi:hypothetical protein